MSRSAATVVLLYALLVHSSPVCMSNERLYAEVEDLNAQLCEVKRVCGIRPDVPYDTLGEKLNPATSCFEIAQRRVGAASGPYYIKSRDNVTQVYCHMGSLGECGGQGWTTLMKVDGRKSADRGTQLGYVSIDRNSPQTLQSLISDNQHRSTSVGRGSWLPALPGAALQPNCNSEGFNAKDGRSTGARARIVIIGNNENSCFTPGTVFGVGLGGLAVILSALETECMSVGSLSKS